MCYCANGPGRARALPLSDAPYLNSRPTLANHMTFPLGIILKIYSQRHTHGPHRSAAVKAFITTFSLLVFFSCLRPSRHRPIQRLIVPDSRSLNASTSHPMINTRTCITLHLATIRAGGCPGLRTEPGPRPREWDFPFKNKRGWTKAFVPDSKSTNAYTFHQMTNILTCGTSGLVMIQAGLSSG